MFKSYIAISKIVLSDRKVETYEEEFRVFLHTLADKISSFFEIKSISKLTFIHSDENASICIFPYLEELFDVKQEHWTMLGEYDKIGSDIKLVNFDGITQTCITPDDKIKTLIHEMAHHVQYCIHGDTSHDKGFYKINNNILNICFHSMNK